MFLSFPTNVNCINGEMIVFCFCLFVCLFVFSGSLKNKIVKIHFTLNKHENDIAFNCVTMYN